jgi:hypothetical protein
MARALGFPSYSAQRKAPRREVAERRRALLEARRIEKLNAEKLVARREELRLAREDRIARARAEREERERRQPAPAPVVVKKGEPDPDIVVGRQLVAEAKGTPEERDAWELLRKAAVAAGDHALAAEIKQRLRKMR